MARGVQIDLANNAQLKNDTRAFNTLVDHVDTASVLSGGLAITPTWTIGGVNGSVTAKYALMSTGGGGVVGSGSFGTTVLPNAVPNGGDGYTLLYLPINGSYSGGTVNFSLVFTGATATVTGAGNPVVDLYVAPRAGGELDTSATAWTEVIGGILNLTGWTSLNVGSTVTCTGSATLSALPVGKYHFVLQVACKVTGNNTGTTAQVQLTSGTITLPTPSLNDIWEVQNKCAASGFPSGGPYSVTLDFPFAVGDMWIAHIRRVQSSDLNDITGSSEAHTTTIVERVHSALNDSNANIISIFTGIVTSTASSGLTPTFTANSSDVGVIVEFHLRAFRNMTGSGALAVDAVGTLGNAVGSPGTTGTLNLTLNHAPQLIAIEATGQSGNWRASGSPFLTDLVAANNSIYDDYVTSTGSHSITFTQSPTNGFGINAVGVFVQGPATGLEEGGSWATVGPILLPADATPLALLSASEEIDFVTLDDGSQPAWRAIETSPVLPPFPAEDIAFAAGLPEDGGSARTPSPDPAPMPPASDESTSLAPVVTDDGGLALVVAAHDATPPSAAEEAEDIASVSVATLGVDEQPNPTQLFPEPQASSVQWPEDLAAPTALDETGGRVPLPVTEPTPSTAASFEEWLSTLPLPPEDASWTILVAADGTARLTSAGEDFAVFVPAPPIVDEVSGLAPPQPVLPPPWYAIIDELPARQVTGSNPSTQRAHAVQLVRATVFVEEDPLFVGDITNIVCEVVDQFGAPADPGVVTANVRTPDGVVTAQTVTRTGPGVYQITGYVWPQQFGYFVQFQGTAPFPFNIYQSFSVQASPF